MSKCDCDCETCQGCDYIEYPVYYGPITYDYGPITYEQHLAYERMKAIWGPLVLQQLTPSAIITKLWERG